MAAKAKKLNDAQITLLRKIAAEGKKGECVGIDRRVAEALRKRGLVTRQITWTVHTFYITKAGRDYLMALDSKSDALPATAPDAGSDAPADTLRQALRDVKVGDTYPVETLWDGISEPEPEPDLAAQLADMRRELADVVLERNAAIDDRRRYMKALEDARKLIWSGEGGSIATGGNGYIVRVLNIIDRVLGEPEGGER